MFINSYLGQPQKQIDLLPEIVIWYVYSVSRQLEQESWNDPKKPQLSLVEFCGIRNCLMVNDRAVKSIERELGENGLLEIVSFGDGFSGTLSKRTTGYQTAAELIREKLPSGGK